MNAKRIVHELMDMSQVNISQVTPQEYYKLVEVHNLGFADHIRKYGRFSSLRKLSVKDIKEWRQNPPFGSKGLLKAQVKGSIVGYCYVKKEFDTVGHLGTMGSSCSLLCVVPTWRRKRIGSRLIANAEQFLQSKRFEFVVAWVYKSDISARMFLKKTGYKHQREFFVEDFSRVLPLNADVEFWQKDLTKEILPRGIKLSQDYSVRPFRSGDEVHFADIYNRVWGPYGRPVMSTEIAKRRIYNEEIDLVFFVEVDGEHVGCTIVDKFGGVSLVGVIPKYRRRGIGIVLLLKTLEYLKRNGQKASYMDTGVPLRGALALYRKLGYKKIEELYCMVKEIA